MADAEGTGPDTVDDPRVVAVTDERSRLAARAFDLIHDAMWDVQPVSTLLAELEETRHGLAVGGDYHLLALVDGRGEPVAAVSGAYLEDVNAGYIAYLAVAEEQRGRLLGRGLRARLVEAFRADARRVHGADLLWAVGEVRRESPWLRTLVRDGRAIPFDLPYFHPWLPRRAEGMYVLYREPVADHRPELPTDEVERLLYAIWHRSYRIRYPLQSDTFRYMLSRLKGRETVGTHPDFAREIPGG
jgi:GNAT superfamily N-acetyltransferase